MTSPHDSGVAAARTLEDRVSFHEEADVMEVNLEGARLTDGAAVRELYDMLERRLAATGRKWFLLVNYRDCVIWPEAWVAHAARGKRLNERWSLGSVRYDASPETQAEIAARAGRENFDANLFPARSDALDHLAALREERLAAIRNRPRDAEKVPAGEYARRIAFDEVAGVMEADFSGFVFSDSSVVHAFYDYIETALEQSGRRWWFLVNYDGCEIWPEAWVAYAMRGKRVNVEHALGSVRYAAGHETAEGIRRRSREERFDANLFDSRAAALAEIDRRKAQG